MQAQFPGSSVSLSISAVERDVGVSKDALRVWERRYGFPNPGRDAFGERIYGPEQVEKLRLIKRLMDIGHRPGKIVPLQLSDLAHIYASANPVDDTGLRSATRNGELLRNFLDLIKRHETTQLRDQLSQALLRMSLANFVIDVIAPLTTAIGEAWARGQLAVHEEHLYTESVQVIMRNAINTIPEIGKPPRVLLTTVPQEQHGLGLLMVEAMLALEGCKCVSLGVQTPIWDIAQAVIAHQADVVALSFSLAMNANTALESLADLRAQLDGEVEIWVGGACSVLQRRAPRGVLVLRELAAVHATVAHWRSQH
jgi:methanogenic corrinoid protein MtbC1